MTSVRKSPNMMSTTGRRPVIAAPTPRPVMPGSEIGESRTRSGPNSCTRPASTLKGVPPAATSSPRMNTVSSRRSSSASASLTAWAKVSVRVRAAASALGEDIFGHLTRVGERRLEREGDPGLDLGARHVFDAFEVLVRRELVLLEPRAEQRERVALAPPHLLLLLGAVVRAVDVADMVAVVAIRVAEEKGRPAAVARPLDEL